MKFEELFKHKPGSVGAFLQKTIDGLNEEIKELRAENAALRGELDFWRDGNIIREEDKKELIALRKELDWKTQRIKTLSDGLHAIEDVLKKTATSVWTDAVESGNKEGQ